MGGLEDSSDLVNHRRAGQLGWKEVSRPGKGRALGGQGLEPGKASRPWTLVGLTHSSSGDIMFYFYYLILKQGLALSLRRIPNLQSSCLFFAKALQVYANMPDSHSRQEVPGTGSHVEVRD